MLALGTPFLLLCRSDAGFLQNARGLLADTKIEASVFFSQR
jgi:hypothetical protein